MSIHKKLEVERIINDLQWLRCDQVRSHEYTMRTKRRYEEEE